MRKQVPSAQLNTTTSGWNRFSDLHPGSSDGLPQDENTIDSPHMKALALKERFITDAGGKRVGVLLDLATYERLREAEEELADIQTYDAARPKVMAEIARGRSSTLGEYQAHRARKSR
jgi:hypothetical protein